MKRWDFSLFPSSVVRVLSLLLSAALLPGLVSGTVRAATPNEDNEGTQCFVSAYYRRVVTHTGFNKIAITVTLPTVTQDRIRDRSDGFHIYLGGTYQGPGASSEVDAGMAWEITRNKWGEVDFVNRAWRPFFRTSSPVTYLNGPATADYYWYPGEEVTLTFEVVRPGWVTLSVSGAGKSYAFDPVQANGFNLDGNQLLKWVASLDQSGREGKGPVPTNAKVEGTHIRDVTLWTPEGVAIKLSEEHVHKPRTCIMPSADPFSIEFVTKYADERITITGLPE